MKRHCVLLLTLSETLETTSRDRPKSAPYLRLKIVKGLQYVKVLVSWGPFHEFFLEKKVSQCRKTKG